MQEVKVSVTLQLELLTMASSSQGRGRGGGRGRGRGGGGGASDGNKASARSAHVAMFRDTCKRLEDPALAALQERAKTGTCTHMV